MASIKKLLIVALSLSTACVPLLWHSLAKAWSFESTGAYISCHGLVFLIPEIENDDEYRGFFISICDPAEDSDFSEIHIKDNNINWSRLDFNQPVHCSGMDDHLDLVLTGIDCKDNLNNDWTLTLTNHGGHPGPTIHIP